MYIHGPADRAHMGVAACWSKTGLNSPIVLCARAPYGCGVALYVDDRLNAQVSDTGGANARLARPQDRCGLSLAHRVHSSHPFSFSPSRPARSLFPAPGSIPTPALRSPKRFYACLPFLGRAIAHAQRPTASSISSCAIASSNNQKRTSGKHGESADVFVGFLHFLYPMRPHAQCF